MTQTPLPADEPWHPVSARRSTQTLVTMATRVLLIAVLALWCSLSGIRAQVSFVKPCNDSRSTTLSFSIVSRKNQTGHWIAEVKLGPEITDNKHNGGWQIHVTENTVDNSGLEPIVSITATLTAPAPIASPGYELFPKIGYYKLHTEGKTWEEARVACENEGAHLAVIHSETESDIIKQLLARYPNLGGPNMVAHIGFNDKITEGQYVTIFGESLASTGFIRWSTIGSQPDDASPGEDCGSVHRNGGLNDIACDHKAPFLCKQDLFAPSNVDKYRDKTIVVGEGGTNDVGTLTVTDVDATGGGEKKDEETAGGGDEGKDKGVETEGKDKKVEDGGTKDVGTPTVTDVVVIGGGEKKDEETAGGGDEGKDKGVETEGKDKKVEDGKVDSDVKDKTEKEKPVTEDPDRFVFEEEPVN